MTETGDIYSLRVEALRTIRRKTKFLQFHGETRNWSSDDGGEVYGPELVQQPENLRTVLDRIRFPKFRRLSTTPVDSNFDEATAAVAAASPTSHYMYKEVYAPKLVQQPANPRTVLNGIRFPKLHRLSTTPADSNVDEATAAVTSPTSHYMYKEYMEEELVIQIERDLEDGELSSDNEEAATEEVTDPQISSESFPSADSELEIDRIIEETQRLTSGKNSRLCSEEFHSASEEFAGVEKISKPQMEEIDHSEDLDIIALRAAALKSLAPKVNGREEGEVSDESARASPCLIKQKVVFNPHGSDGFTAESSKTAKDKYAGLTIQVRQDSKRRDVRANVRDNARKRRHSPSSSRIRSSNRSFDKSSKTKRISTGSLKDIGRARRSQRSSSNRMVNENNIQRRDAEQVDPRNCSTDGDIVDSHADMVLGEMSNNSNDNADIIAPKAAQTINSLSILPPPPPPPILPSVDRSDGPMFGIQLNVTNDIPLPRPHAPRPHDLGRDNYDSIGMDIDNSDNSRPASAPGTTTFDDEAERMRKQLLQQLQQSRENTLNASKVKSTATPERPTREGAVARNSAATGGYESSAEESYRANRAELSMVENKIQITLRQMDVLADKRRQLMKEMSTLSLRLSDYQLDYLKTLEIRNNLRKEVDIYELEHIRNIRMEEDSFTDITRNMIASDNNRVSTMVSILESSSNDQNTITNSLETEAGAAINASKNYITALNEHTVVTSSEKEIIDKLIPQRDVDELLPPARKNVENACSRARRVSSMTEDELRALLLNNVKTTRARRPFSDSNSTESEPLASTSAYYNDGPGSHARTTQVGDVKEEVDDEQQDEYLEDDTYDHGMEDEIRDSGVEDANQSSGVSSECDAQPMVVNDPYSENINVNKETERARQIENECGLPVRLHYHAGLTRKLNNMSVICPYEMWGLCKDYSCTYQHLNDSKLPLHTILLMILNFAPDLAGPENRHYGIREKIKKVVLMKEDKETARQFVKRLLRKLPQVEKTAAFLSSENDQLTTGDERADFESYYEDLHISAAPASA